MYFLLHIIFKIYGMGIKEFFIWRKGIVLKRCVRSGAHIAYYKTCWQFCTHNFRIDERKFNSKASKHFYVQNSILLSPNLELFVLGLKKLEKLSGHINPDETLLTSKSAFRSRLDDKNGGFEESVFNLQADFQRLVKLAKTEILKKNRGNEGYLLSSSNNAE